MRIPPWVILVAGTVVIVVVAAGATFALGGDDDDDGGQVATGTPTPTQATGDPFGKAPAMTEHITQVIPAHGLKVQQRNTRPTASGPSGVCAVVNYKDLAENNQWFRMAFDDKEVTQELTLIIKGTQASPEGATMCYAPDGGVPVGIHSAAIIMQDPRDTSGTARELVAWKFEVIP
jgi:hypothetical protein